MSRFWVETLGWKIVFLVIIAMVITKANAIPPVSHRIGRYFCQGKAYEAYSHKMLSQMMKVTNATVWEGKNVWGCEYALVQTGFHKYNQKPMELIQIDSRCCDTCLSTCPEF